jgi:hypothetical protein
MKQNHTYSVFFSVVKHEILCGYINAVCFPAVFSAWLTNKHGHGHAGMYE